MAIRIPSRIDQNPRYQNGVAHFVQESPPAWRDEENLVPLVEGDCWYKPIDNGVTGSAGLWLWRSPYWLSATNECPTLNVQHSSTTTSTVVLNVKQGFKLLLEEFLIATRDPLTADGSNYWSIQGRYDSSGTTNIPGALIVINQNASYSKFSVPLSFVLPVVSGGTRYLISPSFTKVGTPTNLACTYSYRYREIHP